MGEGVSTILMDNINNYQVGNLLGRGGFASVFKARCISSELDVAIKMVDKKQMKMKGMHDRVRQEVAIHHRLKHPSILELITFFEDENYVYLVLELCHNGELAKFQKQNNMVFTEPEARSVFDQVVSGLRYLHSHGIMHRDLTLANLMLTSDMKVKIGDFGLATKLATPAERHVTMCGTPNFMAPEVATRSSHGLETDVWGLGVILYTLLVGRPPFDTPGVKSTLTKVVMGDYTLPDHLTPEAKDLISNLLKKNKTDRMLLSDIPAHPWMRTDTHQAQDSGMYTMSTTNFSTNKSGPKPISTFPALTEYSEENEMRSSYYPPPQQIISSSRSTPHLQPPSSPPVKMVSDPQDLIGVPQAPLASLRSKLSSLPSMPAIPTHPTNHSHHSTMSVASNFPSLSRQFSNPETRVLSDLRPMDVENRSIRSNMSDPSKPSFTHPQEYNPGYNHGPSSLRPHYNQVQSLQPQYNSLPTVSQPQYNPAQRAQQPQYNHPQPLPQYNPTSVPQPQYNIDHTNSATQPKYSPVKSLPQYNQPSLAQYTPSHTPSPVPILSSLPPRLTTSRLRTTRQKTKNVVAHISESGEVCLEFIKMKRGEEKVGEVMRISADGDRVVVYNPGGGVPLGPSPPPMPSVGADFFYSYQTLPQKYWKKYQYAARFVNLVKASTPKIILYTGQAKCYVMENDDKDFEMHFYNGMKATLISSEVKIFDTEAKTHTFSFPLSTLPPALSLTLTHLNSSYTHCMKVLTLLLDMDSPSLPAFPVTLGRKPLAIEHVVNNSWEKENRAPQGVVQGMTDTMLSRVTTTSSPYYQHSLPGRQSPSFPDNTRKVAIPGLGEAMQLPDGNVRVNYQDSSCVVLRSQSSSVDYYQPSQGGAHHGSWQVYDHSNMPGFVKSKLEQMPKILELLKGGHIGVSRPASVR